MKEDAANLIFIKGITNDLFNLKKMSFYVNILILLPYQVNETFYLFSE